MHAESSNLKLRVGQTLITVGAALAFLAMLDIHPIRAGLWPFTLASTVFLVGIAFLLFGMRQSRRSG
jgi:hypothetical protein